MACICKNFLFLLFLDGYKTTQYDPKFLPHAARAAPGCCWSCNCPLCSFSLLARKTFLVRLLVKHGACFFSLILGSTPTTTTPLGPSLEVGGLEEEEEEEGKEEEEEEEEGVSYSIATTRLTRVSMVTRSLKFA